MPWHVAEEMGSDYRRWLQDGGDYDICMFELDNEIDAANLAFIVKAVNNHEKLVHLKNAVEAFLAVPADNSGERLAAMAATMMPSPP